MKLWIGTHPGASGDVPHLISLPSYSISFEEPVFYHDHTEKFPKTKEKCGRWLGVAHNIGDAMTFKVLAENNQILERSVIRSARDPERPNKTVKATEESDNSSEPEHILDSKPPPQLPHKARTKPVGNRKQERRGVRRPNTVEVEGSASDPDLEDLSQFVNALQEEDPEVAPLPTKQSEQQPEPPFHAQVPAQNAQSQHGRNHHRLRDFPNEIGIKRNLCDSCSWSREPSQPWPSSLLVPNCWPPTTQLHPSIMTPPIMDPRESDPCMHFGQYGQSSIGEVSQEQLSYVRAMDAVDEDDTTWKVAQMVGHKVKKHHGSQSLMAKVDWFTGPSSWVDFQALKSHDPYAMIQYAWSKDLLKHPDFEWTEEFMDNSANWTKFVRPMCNRPRGSSASSLVLRFPRL